MRGADAAGRCRSSAARCRRRRAARSATCARRLMAAFSVEAPSWNRYSGQMSMVPPARSMRVGAEAVDARTELYRLEFERHVASRAPPSDRPAAHRRLQRPAAPRRAEVARARVRAGRRHPVRAQHRRAGAGGRAVATRPPGSTPELPRLGQRRSGGRPRRAAEGAVHRVAADGDARPQRRRRGWPSGSRARWPRSCRAVGITLDYAPVLDVHTNPKNPVIGDRALAEKAEDVARARRARSSARCRRRASPPAASTFPGTATRAPIRTSSCRWSSIRPSGCAQVEFVPFRAAIEARVATIMTAHVLVPALDETAAGDAVAAHRHGPPARGAAASTA